MRLDQLTAADFPGVDSAKFEEWKAVQLDAKRYAPLGPVIFIGGSVLLLLTGNPLVFWAFITAIAAYFAIVFPKFLKSLKLTQALGIETQVKAKLKEQR